ncbi:hypothetical protein ACVW1A_001274 [Bradyrhizobium sp. LB1.3]
MCGNFLAAAINLRLEQHVPAATGLAFRRGLGTSPSSPELAPDRRLGLSGGGPVTAIRTQLLASTWPLRPDDTACAA